MPAQPFESVTLGVPLNLTMPSIREVICTAYNNNPLYFDEPIRSAEIAEMFGISTTALTSLHYRGSGPKFSTPEGKRRRYYTRRSVLEWLYSDDPVAQRKIKQLLREMAQ